MEDFKIFATTLVSVLCDRVGSVLQDEIQRRYQLSVVNLTVIAVLLHAFLFIAMFSGYSVLAAFLRKRRMRAVRGHYVQVKRPSSAPESGSLEHEDYSRYPLSLLTIETDPTSEKFLVEGVTVSNDNDIRFRSTNVLGSIEDQELAFQFEAEVGSHKVCGLSTILFHPDVRGRYREGTGYFLDSRGFRMDFRLQRVDGGSHDLDVPSERIRYLREMLSMHAPTKQMSR